MMRSVEVATAPLSLISDLCGALDGAGVRYCHWKSTDALDRSATGENDLDLLIAENDVVRFEAIVRKLGFVEALVGSSQRQPGIRHFYGLDRSSGRLVDVHAHERLIIGDDATKNYWLPIEAAYLASSLRAGLFMVPDPELELAVFVVRMMLKHGSPEAIMSGRGSLSSREEVELRHLSALSDPATRWEALDRTAPMLDRQLLDRCIASFDRGRALRARMEAWRRLERRLAPYARRPRRVDAWLQFSRRGAAQIRRRVFRRPSRKTPAGGGRVVALIGSDGSGKSTTARAMEDWLSPVFRISRIHLGKPPRSPSWMAVRTFMHLRRWIGGGGAATAPVRVGADSMSAAGRGRAWLLMGMLTARDRRRAALRAWRLARRGRIVICDRYPMSQLSVDGPRPRPAPSDLRGVARLLADVDRRQYARIPVPDVVIVLRVTPEIAVRRRPEADPRIIDARAREISEAHWGPDVAVVDATRPFQAVLGDVKAEVWSRL